jgi:hypothetical protein
VSTVLESSTIDSSDMQLTYLLQNSLSGNSKTLVIDWIYWAVFPQNLMFHWTDVAQSFAPLDTSARILDIVAVRDKGRQNLIKLVLKLNLA